MPPRRAALPPAHTRLSILMAFGGVALVVSMATPRRCSSRLRRLPTA